MFTTSWCSFCKRLKMMLGSTEINLVEVDIESTPGTEELVKEINGGNAVVPTIVFSDGSTATNPSLDEVKKRVS
ncbi:MAG: glutaredoxin domain-containing protein [Canibacter sp.]